jgi:hypothetical protein
MSITERSHHAFNILGSGKIYPNRKRLAPVRDIGR